MRVRLSKLASRLFIGAIVASLLVGVGPFSAVHTAADLLLLRSVKISDNHAGDANVFYTMSFFLPVAGTLGSIQFQFCSNSALDGDVCTVPAGFDISGISIVSQNGQSGFSIAPGSTANTLILGRPPANAGIGLIKFEVSGVHNPSSGGSMFGRISTYASSDASGTHSNFGGVALSFQGEVNISLEVPPYLIFCLGEHINNFDCSTATEAFSDLGDLNENVTRAAQHQMVVATNAGNGYSMWAAGGTMTSGNNTITPLAAPTASQKGVAQFGLNLVANNAPSVGQDPQGPGSGAPSVSVAQTNRFFFHSGDVLASSLAPDAYRKYTVSYIVNVPKAQPGGVYSTTLTYVCLANF